MSTYNGLEKRRYITKYNQMLTLIFKRMSTILNIQSEETEKNGINDEIQKGGSYESL